MRKLSLQTSFVNLCQTGVGSMKDTGQRACSPSSAVPRIRQISFQGKVISQNQIYPI